MDTVTCPKCAAANRDGARFCEQCGAAIQTDAVTDAAAKQPVNWAALAVTAALLLGMAWLLFGPKPGDGGPADKAATMAGSPHGDGGAADVMGDLKLDESKARLIADPLDVEALSNLYSAYGQIGRGIEVRPYLDKAVAELAAREAELGDELSTISIRIGMAAVIGHDPAGGFAVFEQLVRLRPDYHPAKRLMGDVCQSLDQLPQAINWYTQFLDATGPETGGRDYWDTLYFRATTYLQRYETAAEEERDPADLELCIADLQTVTGTNPDYVEAYFGLGEALHLAGEDEGAVVAWGKARDLAEDEHQQWLAEAAIAHVQGVDPPAPPESMQGGMHIMGGPSSHGEDNHSHGPDSSAHGGV